MPLIVSSLIAGLSTLLLPALLPATGPQSEQIPQPPAPQSADNPFEERQREPLADEAPAADESAQEGFAEIGRDDEFPDSNPSDDREFRDDDLNDDQFNDEQFVNLFDEEDLNDEEFEFAGVEVEDQDEERERDEQFRAEREEARGQYERLQRRLDEIEELVEQAEREGNEPRIDELRREAEEIFDLLDELQREFGHEEGEAGDERFGRERLEELQLHREALELERLELEARFGRLELIQRLSDISAERRTAAAWAIMHIEEQMELEGAIVFLNNCVSELGDDEDDQSLRRLIRIKLTELYRRTDQPDAAHQQLRALILGR